MLDTPLDAMLHPSGRQHALLALLLLLGAVVGGCGGGQDGSYDMGWLLGASSTFEATTEGAVDGSLVGTATLRMDKNGHLVGIELVHIDDTTRGISIELDPRPPAARTYSVIDPSLLGVGRGDDEAGFTAFFESTVHSFQAERGTLQITEASASEAYGTFTIEMEGQAAQGIANSSVTVEGTFEATRRAD
jgi:hypothetical protein